MKQRDEDLIQHPPKQVKIAWILIAVTIVVSLLYAAQYFAGGPLRLPVVSRLSDLDVSAVRGLAAAAADDGSVRIWDLRGDWAMTTLPAHKGAVTGVAFNQDGSALYSAGEDGKIRKWDVAAGQVRQDFDAGDAALTDIDLSRDDAVIAAAGVDGFVRVFDARSGEMRLAIGPIDDLGPAVAISPDDSQVAASEGDVVQVWDAHSGQPLQSLRGYCKDKQFSTIKECKKASKHWMGHEKPITSLAFSPDGALLASGGEDTSIIFWDWQKAQVKWKAGGHWAAVTSLAFNDEGNAMLSGGADNKVRTWRLPGGKSSAYYEGHLSAVNGVDFGVKENTILSASDDGTVREWETLNQKTTHIAWPRYGLQSEWGETVVYWLFFSGLLGFFVLFGMWKFRPWGHLLGLMLFIWGPVVILGLPLLETLSYPLSWGLKLRVATPLIIMSLWYAGLVLLLTHESISDLYESPPSLPLSDRLMIRAQTHKFRGMIYTTAVWLTIFVALYSVLRRFNLDIAFMRHWLPFIMKGSGLTIFVSLVSIVLAIVLALLGALGRLSKSSIANGVSGFYISLIRGTPLLVQVYIWYLGLPRLGIILQPITAGILALGVNYGAYMTEIFRAGIQAIGKGQYEAAEALGMSRTQAYKRIILPQAFRIVIPPIGNQFIAMMKDSSLVSLMSVWELSYRAQKVGRQYFRALETFIIAAAFYWILTVIFQLLQGKLEEYMARGERR